MIPRLFLLILSAVAAGGQCLPVSGDRILARDMARAAPVFAAVTPEVVLGSAPAPGGRTVYTAAEVARIARRYGLTAEPGVEACFIRPVEVLTRERVMAALRAAMPTARIELIDFSRQPVPRGELGFSLKVLMTDAAADAARMWHGAICAPGQADFPVWAKVRIQVAGQRVVSLEALAAGRPIERAQLREESYVGRPGLPDLNQVTSYVPRRPIPAGTVIEAQWLDPPEDIVRGELVRLEVRSGRARVRVVAIAEASGRRGDFIAVRITDNGKIVRAHVVDRLLVALAADGGSPLAEQPSR
ncbi:MAG: flagellar basal body P-ring formation chaperone FlgA [Bryobacteraceae bacterium]